MRRRGLILLAAAGAGSIGAAVLLAPGDTTPPQTGGALAFPGLAERLSSAASLEIRRADATLRVKREGDRWLLPDRNDYPIREARLRELLTGLSELRLLESRGSDPANFARLGVDDPASPGSTANHLRLLDAQGNAIVDVFLGRRRIRTQGNLPESITIRRAGDTEAWVAEGRIPVETDAASWMERDVANLAAERVQRVVVQRVGVPAITIARAAPGSPLLVTEPADPPQIDRTALDDIARAFEFLTFMDALPAAQTPGEAQGQARFELTDNLAITVWGSRFEQHLFIRMTAESNGAGSGEGEVEARLLNARWAGWAYQVGIWKEKAFLPTLEDLTGGR